MIRFVRPRAFALIVAVLTILAVEIPAGAQTQSDSSNVPITATVTVLGPKFSTPPPVGKEDVTVRSGKSPSRVIQWIPAANDKAGLQLAIVIDDGASQDAVGPQLRDLDHFINAQSRNTAVGVFYAAHGTVQTASPFSTDHRAVSKTLRVPLGARAGDSPSIYLSLRELLSRHWPPTGGRREVLLISSGIDRLDQGPQSPYVQAAIDDVQKASVVIHTIYVGASLRFGESLRGQYAQSNLEQITAASGGYAFFQGLTTPVSFSPYLEQLNTVLRNQYLMTFTAGASNHKEGDLREIEVRVEQRNVELKYPKRVFVPRQAD